MTMCYVIARRSGDQSTHVGAVIVGTDNSIVSVGYNDLPRNIEDTISSRRSAAEGEKYLWTEHSERNAIYNAGRNGVPLKGCKMYVNLLPCTDCARAIIQSGIKEVVCHAEGHDAFYEARGEENRWQKPHETVGIMFIEAQVKLTWWKGEVHQPAFFSGKRIQL